MRPSRICQFYACSLLWRATQSEPTVRPSSPAPSLFVQCSPPIDGITALFWCLHPTGVNFKAIRENTRTHGRAKLRALRLNSITDRILSSHYRLSPCNMVLWDHQKFGTRILSSAFVRNRRPPRAQIYIVHGACGQPVDTPLTWGPGQAASPPDARCCGVLCDWVEQHEHVEKKEGLHVLDTCMLAWDSLTCLRHQHELWDVTTVTGLLSSPEDGWNKLDQMKRCQ